MNGSSHLDEQGRARMVDVGAKAETRRVAVAEAWLELGDDAYEALASGENPKGDALAAARIAGIQAAKRTSDLIPMCHPLFLDSVQVGFEPDGAGRRVRVLCEARTHGRTGVEMEAMTGAAVAALTLYDMLKSVEKGIRVTGLRLLSKDGGKSGRWEA
ncbi:MAG: cyclic pyranopterin monophosphate synthase MoaC [Planctomycetota bacterium]